MRSSALLIVTAHGCADIVHNAVVSQESDIYYYGLIPIYLSHSDMAGWFTPHGHPIVLRDLWVYGHFSERLIHRCTGPEDAEAILKKMGYGTVTRY
jgi:hypothetical protein